MKKIIKIAITGGVCSGKTSCMAHLKDYYRDKGIAALFVPETATVLVNEGKDTRGESMYIFQESVLLRQIENEEKAETEALSLPGDVSLVITDRGAADAFGYLSGEDASRLVKAHGFTFQELLTRYDGVIHLVTAADGALEFYNCANNAARTETPKEAILGDNLIKKAWESHPNRIIIGNEGGMSGKLRQITDFIDKQIALHS